jgi:hypothetical protein
MRLIIGGKFKMKGLSIYKTIDHKIMKEKE